MGFSRLEFRDIQGLPQGTKGLGLGLGEDGRSEVAVKVIRGWDLMFLEENSKREGFYWLKFKKIKKERFLISETRIEYKKEKARKEEKRGRRNGQREEGGLPSRAEEREDRDEGTHDLLEEVGWVATCELQPTLAHMITLIFHHKKTSLLLLNVAYKQVFTKLKINNINRILVLVEFLYSRIPC